MAPPPPAVQATAVLPPWSILRRWATAEAITVAKLLRPCICGRKGRSQCNYGAMRYIATDSMAAYGCNEGAMSFNYMLMKIPART